MGLRFGRSAFLFQVFVEEVEQERFALFVVEFPSPVAGAFDDVKRRLYLGFAVQVVQQAALDDVDERVLVAVNEQDRGVVFRDVAGRTGKGNQLLLLRRLAAE